MHTDRLNISMWRKSSQWIILNRCRARELPTDCLPAYGSLTKASAFCCTYSACSHKILLRTAMHARPLPRLAGLCLTIKLFNLPNCGCCTGSMRRWWRGMTSSTRCSCASAGWTCCTTRRTASACRTSTTSRRSWRRTVRFLSGPAAMLYYCVHGGGIRLGPATAVHTFWRSLVDVWYGLLLQHPHSCMCPSVSL